MVNKWSSILMTAFVTGAVMGFLFLPILFYICKVSIVITVLTWIGVAIVILGIVELVKDCFKHGD